jgi:hypothetical protein
MSGKYNIFRRSRIPIVWTLCGGANQVLFLDLDFWNSAENQNFALLQKSLVHNRSSHTAEFTCHKRLRNRHYARVCDEAPFSQTISGTVCKE